MDITTNRRDTGTYAILTTGRQTWTDAGQTWAAHGVRLDLMDGQKALAVCKLEVPGETEAEERGALVATQIEPWVLTLRYLAVVRNLQSTLDAVEALELTAQDQEQWSGLSPDTADEINAFADQDDDPAAQGSALCRRIAARLRSQITYGRARALAYAPTLDTPIHPAWTQSGLGETPGEPTATMVARELLTAWAATRDMRDGLITWAVTTAGLTRTEVQQTTGVSRSTINRLLP
ncbi:hypothetical protein EES45_22840 [Streptomyces sp. ADI97-07]|uniref:hypothetical protein n=1 Tax=Streptomyces sp. ADI97-07 TaxID=1522762 RepID=UPI000F54E914|nr:hypothetical protein [Streptomyces sp. ADI97-07]RPK76599.1 hypothetical protein EES45_22840 [Streptomyces sp. ADI97-07]